jgi:phosphomannomutase
LSDKSGYWSRLPQQQPVFAESSARVFAANGIKAYLFEDLRPTPELSLP